MGREGERERERSSSVIWIHLITAGAKPAKAHTNSPWKGRQTVLGAGEADGGE